MLAEPRFREGFDAVLIAHLHRPIHQRPEGRDFIVLGDWIDRRTVVKLVDGAFSMFEFGAAKPGI